MSKRSREVSDSEDEVKYLKTEHVSDEEDEEEDEEDEHEEEDESGAPEYFEQAALIDLTGPDTPEYFAQDPFTSPAYEFEEYVPGTPNYEEDPFTSPAYEFEEYVPGTPNYEEDPFTSQYVPPPNDGTTEGEESDDDPFEGSNSGF
jgi:hypothetical protein